MEINALLSDREKQYGQFGGHAAIAQGLKEVMHQASNWQRLTPPQKESLDMIQHKIARILNGDPDYIDNWVDICGYSQLEINILRGK
jgi:hypothetical protein